ncbi:unnamed protein product [Vicia faba]|uniref:Uncharacterized protein n=1 Tax=Vicia faba TaxID=3906 RepID=A0AAV0Z5G9_VICFA|nr:unnamed protein product [Vicia faba]
MNQNLLNTVSSKSFLLVSTTIFIFLQLVSFFLELLGLAVISRSLQIREHRSIEILIALVADLWSSALHCCVALAHYLRCYCCCSRSILLTVFHVSASSIWFAHFMTSYPNSAGLIFIDESLELKLCIINI